MRAPRIRSLKSNRPFEWRWYSNVVTTAILIATCSWRKKDLIRLSLRRLADVGPARATSGVARIGFHTKATQRKATLGWKRLVVLSQNGYGVWCVWCVTHCKTPCMPAPRAHVFSTCARGAGIHGDVLNVYQVEGEGERVGVDDSLVFFIGKNQCFFFFENFMSTLTAR